MSRACSVDISANRIAPLSLGNDNFVGYMDSCLHEQDVTWMEKTVSTPYWTGLTVMSIDRRQGQKRMKSKLLDPISAVGGRVLFKGSLFSAPLNWGDLQDQLQALENTEAHIAVPVHGEVLAARVRISIASGLVDLNRVFTTGHRSPQRRGTTDQDAPRLWAP